MGKIFNVLHMSEVIEGGVARHLQDIFSAKSRRTTAILAAPKGGEVLTGKERFYPVPIARKPSPAQLMALLKLAFLIDRLKPDVLHLHSSIAGTIGRVAVTISRWKPVVVYTPHCFAFTYYEEPYKKRLFRLTEKHLAHLTYAIVCVSETERNIAYSIGIPARKLVVIPNGIHPPPQITQTSRALARESLSIPEDRSVIGTVGRMSRQKDPMHFVYAAEQIATVVPQSYFVWVGDGPLRDSVEREVERLGLKSRFIITGWRNDAEKLLHAFDVFVLSSISEGLPYTLLEAMGAGLPPVVTDVAGCRDVVRHGADGFVTPVGKPKALAEAIVRLLRNKLLRRKMGIAARERVIQNFTLESMVEKIDNLYEQLLRRKRRI